MEPILHDEARDSQLEPLTADKVSVAEGVAFWSGAFMGKNGATADEREKPPTMNRVAFAAYPRGLLKTAMSIVPTSTTFTNSHPSSPSSFSSPLTVAVASVRGTLMNFTRYCHLVDITSSQPSPSPNAPSEPPKSSPSRPWTSFVACALEARRAACSPPIQPTRGRFELS